MQNNNIIDDEIWVDVVGYENLYKVSDKGRVKSFFGRKRFKREKILKPMMILGYCVVGIWKDEIQKNISIHRIMAFAFLPNPENKTQVNHKNGIKNDNRIENLEWVTPKENMRHAVDTKLLISLKGEKHYKWGKFGGDNFLSKKVVQKDKNGITIATFNSMTEAAKSVNTSKGIISRVCSGKHKTAKGYKWGYV